MRRYASPCASLQTPRSHGEMRPSGDTAVASVITRPAPPVARAPRWTRCQSVGKPSSVAEYWHIGDTKMRFRISTSRKRNGWKRALMRAPVGCGATP
ncbi:MAG: hypothetical protein AMXMBFR23_09350 [Chloroflexota bacterium]